MSVVSLVYLVFVAAAVVLYYVVPIKIRQWVLLAASAFYFVYGCGIWLFLLMCAMALCAWGAANAMEKKPKHRNIIAACAVIAIVSVLILYKDLTFFTVNAILVGRILHIESIFGVAIANFSPPAWVAPLGISYFSLMLIGYILDVNWEKIKAERNPLKVILFTCYFPQMLLGPFTRYDEIKDDLFTGHRFEYENFTFGLQRVLWGLFKKLVIAERFAAITNAIFGNYEILGGGYIAIGAMAYVGQIYMDFSAAMDMIIGISQLFGISLPENFQQPFRSRSLSEIWRRWHMTLGFWLKDYILYPIQKAFTTRFGQAARKKLGKKRGKDLILYLSMLISWFCVGFWHGGTWKYICSSGLFFFVMIVGGLQLQPLFDRLKKFLHIKTEAWSWHLFQSIRSFLLFSFSVSFGRAESLQDGFKMWKLAIVDISQNVLDVAVAWVDQSLYAKIDMAQKDLHVLIVAMLVILIVSTLQLKEGIRQRLARQNLVFRWMLFLCLFAAILTFGFYGVDYNPADFIYAGF